MASGSDKRESESGGVKWSGEWSGGAGWRECEVGDGRGGVRVSVSVYVIEIQNPYLPSSPCP